MGTILFLSFVVLIFLEGSLGFSRKIPEKTPKVTQTYCKMNGKKVSAGYVNFQKCGRDPRNRKQKEVKLQICGLNGEVSVFSMS